MRLARHMDLSRFSAAQSARLSHLSLEGDRTFPSQCRMPSAWIVEPAYVFKDDQLCLDGFEEDLD